MINSETKLTSKIDWISVTIKVPVYPANWSKLKVELSHGMIGYDTAIRYDDGRLELCSSTRKDMEAHVIFSGKCIDRLCEDHQINSIDVLSAMGRGKVTRLDIAVDIRDGKLDIGSLVASFENGTAKTKAQKGLHLSGVKIAGETFYIGSKSSPRRVRVYDKAAESGLSDVDWTRVEFQMRQVSANNASRKLCESNDPHSLIPKLINAFVDFPEVVEWAMVMGMDKIGVSQSIEHESNRRKWLIEMVTRAMSNEMMESGEGISLLNEFADRVVLLYNQKLDDYK